MIKYVIIAIIIFILIMILFPEFVECILRKNHYKSKQNIVEKYIAPNITNLDKKKIQILDFGSGSGALSQSLKIYSNKYNVTSIDVTDVHVYGNKPIIYDGYNIPALDNSYDIVVCLFVLHHIPHQNKILNEMIRVCKTRLLIMEDCRDTCLDSIMTTIHGYSSYGQCNNCFHSTDKWKQIFNSKGLTVNKIISLPRLLLPIYPVSRKLFVLDK